MTTFDEREKAFENKFVHDEDLHYREDARRNKLVGLWAASILGKSGQEATDYAMSVVMADLEEPGIEDVVRKLAGDLEGKTTIDQIRAKLMEFTPEAHMQIMTEI